MRRIPKSRRHKKLKFVDPCYSSQPTNCRKRKQGKNEPPKHEDFQEMSHNLRELIDNKNKVKQNKLKRRRKKKNALKDDFIIVDREIVEDGHPGMTRPLKSVPEKLVQKPNESVKQFLNKLQQMTSLAIAEAGIEQKYDVNLYHVDNKNVAVVQSGEDSKEMQKNVRKNSEQTSKRKKKVKVADNSGEISLIDTVKFGEVVQEPPTLLVKPKKSMEITKPGSRNLHLRQMLNSNGKDSSVTNKITAAKRKRKHVSDERRRILEEERIRVVDLYRTLKQKNVPFSKT